MGVLPLFLPGREPWRLQLKFEGKFSMNDGKPRPAPLGYATLMAMSIYDLARVTSWSEPMLKNLALLGAGAGDRSAEKVRWDNSEKVKQYNQRVREWFARLAREVTLGDVLRVLEAEYAQMRHAEYGVRHKNHLRKICELGLTRLDSIALPQETIDLALLRKLPREKLLALDGRYLASIGEKTMANYREWAEKKNGTPPPPFTVGELLAQPPEGHELAPAVAVATWRLLLALGFGEEEGPFMAAASRLAQLPPRRLVAPRKKKAPPLSPAAGQYKRLVAGLVKRGEVTPEIAQQLVAKAMAMQGADPVAPEIPPLPAAAKPLGDSCPKRRCFSKPTARSQTNICGVAKIVKKIKGMEFQYYVAMIYPSKESQRKKHFSVQRYGEAKALALAKKQRRAWELEYYGPAPS